MLYLGPYGRFLLFAAFDLPAGTIVCVFTLRGPPVDFVTDSFPLGIEKNGVFPFFGAQVSTVPIYANINGHGIIERWERIYLEEGLEGLAVERRGRKCTEQSAKLSKKVEEDLIAENQRLRAEVDYLKNLQALVLEEERRQHRKRR